MSGIMALLALDGRPVSINDARAQLDAIAHRGDRAPRLWHGEGVALGHVNLPTTPEAEAEDLPAPDPSGRLWITWDGRLDNRDDLARALHIDATAARTMTDADFVLAAYARWGAECVRHLLGDWAMMIWDAPNRRLFCAKDPLGWRQLYYVVQDGVLAVGSEPRQLFAGGLCRPAINHEYVLRYLAGAMQEPGETCYAGMRELEGGQILTAVDGAVAVHTYWHRPQATPLPFRRPEEYVDEFVAVFQQATKARLRSNRSVGVYLSGGLDSSYVAAVAAGEGIELTAITGYAPGTRWIDERPYARLVAERIGIRHVEVDISDCWALSSRHLEVGRFDQVAHPPQSPHMMLLGNSAQQAGLGVMLGGEGGDDWMSGSGYAVADALLRGKLRTGWRLASGRSSKQPTMRRFARAALRGTVPYTVQDAFDRVRRPRRSSHVASPVAVEPHWIDPDRFARTLAWQRRRSLEVECRIRQDVGRSIVSWLDRHVLAANQLELRSPFHDQRIVELMAATPEWVKQHHGRPKDILRAAGYRLLPSLIFDRLDKSMFNELVVAGMCVEERARVLMATETAARFPGVAQEQVETGALCPPDARHDEHWDVRPWWRLISVGLWLHYLAALHEPATDRTTYHEGTVKCQPQ